MKEKYISTVMYYGRDILSSKNMQLEKEFIQHGDTTTFEHSVNVACISMLLLNILHIRADMQALVRGALLHDYYLYDWHIEKNDKLHGFAHAGMALENAKRDFEITELEQDIIEKHMFPLNIKPPMYRESIAVCVADKLCAVAETFYLKRLMFYAGRQ